MSAATSRGDADDAEARSIIGVFLAKWRDSDVAGVVACFADDAIVQLVLASPSAATFIGREQIQGLMQGLVPGFRVVPCDYTVHSDALTGEVSVSGRVATVQARVVNGKIASLAMTFGSRMGTVPAAPARGASGTIAERVRRALAHSRANEYAGEYHRSLVENINRTDDKFQRSVIAVFLLMGALVWLPEVKQISYRGATLTDPTILYRALPVVLAYYYSQLVALGSMRVLMLRVHEELLVNRCKSFVDQQLETYIVASSHMNTTAILTRGTHGTFTRLLMLSDMPVLPLILFGPVAFEAYTFVHLFKRFQITDIGTWIALVVSSVFIVRGLLYLSLVRAMQD